MAQKKTEAQNPPNKVEAKIYLRKAKIVKKMQQSYHIRVMPSSWSVSRNVLILIMIIIINY